MKLRNLMGAVLALAGVAFCGTAAGGDVWEFIPDSPTGTNYTAGTTVQFRMRVLTRNYEGPADDLAPFMKTPNFDNYTVQAAFLADPVHAAETLNADYPLQIGVVANGKTVGAKLVTSNVTNDNLATDFVFAYTVQTGDYALPLRLAADANGNPINSGASTSKFFFLYGPGSGNEIWSIKATTRPVPGVESETFTFDPQMVSQGTSETEVMKREVIPYNKDGDYLRASFRFDLETLEFDGESETGDDGKDYWRVVCGNDSKPFAPRIQTIDGLLPLTGGQKVYIWVAPSGGDDDDLTEWNWPADEEADYAVAIPAGANVLKKAKFTDPDGQEREHNVYVITLAAGTPTYSFPLEGKHVGETARIVLSSSPHWNKVGSTGDWIATDFRVQTVYCGEQKPSISVTDVDGNVKVAVEATTNYTASTMMKIHFDVPYAAGPVTVTLRQKLGDAFVPADDNFISNRYFSILAEPDGDPAVQPSLERITMPAGQQDVYFYVFALGATADTKNPGLTLVPDVSDQSEEIREFFAAGNHRSALLKITDQVPVPSVSAPTSGFSQDMIGVDVTVADNWRDLSTYNTNGYKVVIKLGGQAVCETNGVKFSEGDAQSFAVKIPMEGHPLKGQVQVWDVTHGNTYGVAEFEIDAEAALTAKPAFYPDSASTNAYPEGYFYTEGMSPFLRVNLTSEAKDDMWAFLVPLNEAASNLVECAAYSNGLFIAKGARSSDTATITFLDGYTEKNPMRALFTVDLRSHEKIDAEGSVSYTSTYDPQKVTLSCVNVPSTVTAVKLDTESIKTGGTFYNVPAMIDKTFRAKVADLSEIDLRSGAGYEGKEIWVRFEYTDDWNGWEQAPSKNLYATNGLNNYAEMNVAFTYEGTVQRVNVYALDKDSRAAGVEMDELEWGDPLFTFYVSVSAPQRIIIHDKQKKAVTDEDELVYEEDQMQVLSASSGDFYISLSSQPGSGTPAISKANPIRVKVTLEQYGDGCLDIQTNYVYYTTPADMALKPIRINTATLNGGRESVWWMTAEVDMEDPSATDADGNPWNEHFAAASCMVRVENVDPVIDQATAKGARMAWSEDGTNSVTVGEAITVSWTISDITNDFYKAEWKDEGFQIAWGNVDGVEGGNPLTITNDWPRKKGIGSMGKIYGESKFQVPDRTGAFPITMTVTDGDGGSATKEWWVYVAPSKRAKINVYGPRATAESKYKAAKGVGQGLVAAKGTITLCEQFAQTWEYDETTADAEFYAFGYPATNTWAQFVAENPGSGASADDTFDDGKIPGYLGYSETLHGVPLNKLGNYVSKPDTATVYYDWATHGGRDPDAGRYDSYFYRWMVTKAASEDKGGDTEPAAPAPTLWPFDGTSKTFSLDSGNGENKSGPVTYGTVGIEAIFSRELRERDNLGDINADGIPDKIVELYGLGAEEVGKIPEDDLASLSAFNEDEDFLPNTAGAAIYSSLIPGLPGSWGEGLEFTARMEVRGFHDGLNDGAKLAGLSQYRFDAGFYSDDVEVRKVSRDYSDVEMMAWAEHGYAKDWSPERPTDPTKEDTDEDKFPDGYEYYFWYKAHVGYMENGVHRYLTGRAYDPRNPGEGKFISAATIARMMDPRSDLAPVDFPEGYIDDASDAKTRDTDNDGLPDALEFEIGTNPFDFDTDGDGLPDGFEIMLGGTDPLLAETTKGVSDAMRNFDGDAMAFTTPYLEANGFVLPVPLHVDTFQRFALVDETGDTDGIQWYVGRTAPTNIIASAETFSGVSFTLTDRPNVTYVTSRTTLPVVDGRLACDLLKSEVRTMISTNDDFGVEGDVNIALMPVLIRAGTPVTNVSETVVEYRTLTLAEDLENASTAWVYGRSVTTVTTGDSLANLGGFGMLAIGRYQTAKAGLELAALPAEDDGVAYLHHFVYQEFGFDPRTAWNANTPLAPRWGKTITTGESTETVANNFTGNYGYAGVSARTREYTLYDEFLVMSFFLNNGKLTKADVTATQAFPWEKIWSKYTTNGRGPNEPNWEEDNENYKGRTAETNSGENGADTDLDGVPDGWELYVMAGPKVEDKETKELKYNLVAPYNDGFFSAFGPFVGDAGKASTTDNSATGANEFAAGDGDGLTELQEYAGTDSCAYYSEPWGGNEAPFSATIVRPAEHKDWLNKFFPTDPWNKDTDGDGLGDNEISGKAARFKYGKPVDDGKSTCIPGGGGNPCTVDTDRDGLPDGWEAQFAGQTVYAGEDAQRPKDKDGNVVADGNVLQGYCDGMDGTVFDAYTSPRINNAEENYTVSLNGVAQVVDRDYDKDGLENWQEYLTGAMRCWRYDDPVTVWDYVPDAAFFNPITGEFDLASAMRHTGIKNENEFWYRLLFDTKSQWYNPHFVTASTPSSQYFSRVTNGWDQVFSEAGTYYMFYDRRNGDQLANTWGKAYYDLPVAPTKYISTSPIAADTDQDGMDDGYELFHGMNPLLGAAGVLKSSNGPCDIVYDAWYVEPAGSPVNALENLWIENIPGNGKYDFIVHPWLNGLVDADPDGDDIRNQDEAIMPLVAPHSVWLHTDPTPLWMTDSSYGDSIVSRFFRLPSARSMVPVPDSIVFDGQEYSLIDCDGYMVLPLIGPVIAPFLPDYWQVTGEGAANWAYSFEENEGYDTDHDSGSDFEEKQGKFRSATDPQDADSPRRRQAMYFPGEKAALQSMPFVKEAYPRAAMGYPDDMSFLQYTVECWVRPEAADPTKVYTVLERTSFTDPSHVADERYVRRNFAILIRNGKWCTAFDTNGTLDDSLVEVIGKTDAKVGEWTHVAATYDANRLTLYVNGSEDGYVLSSLKPEYGSSAVVTYPAGSGSVNTNDLVVDGSLEALQGTAHAYWFDSEYTQHAFLIGASFAEADDGDHLDVTKQKGWGRYKEFFKGYVDEVRVWDGARSSGDIAADMKKRYTRDDALANRDDFYDQWVNGRVRYNKDGDGKDMDVIPELRFHWAFDSIPGAENAAAVAQAPHGFLEGDKPIYSRPKNYRIPWWSGIVGAYGSVYEGERNWVPWIPNTVTHLPRFDQTTLDSSYWSENYAGDEAGTYKFARTAEPVSKWTQYVRNETDKPLEFRTTGRRFWLTHNTGSNATVTLDRQFEFTSRHLNQTGDDLLPLGGAFAKYVDVMWDEQGASSMWEQTGVDSDGDGLPDWWQEYVNQNCREGVPEGTYITWDTLIWYEIDGVKVRITAGEAYKRDLAKGAYVDAKGEVHRESEDYKQTADLDADGMPDWWEELKGLHNGAPDPKHGHAWDDPDNDGLANYVEYAVSTNGFLGESVGLNPSEMFTDGVLYDYFRTNGLAGADRRYVGFAMTDHDLIEDSFETEAERKVYSTHLDPERNGWTKWSEARAIYNRATWRVVGTERKFKTVEFKYNSAEENYFYATNQNFIALTEYHYTDKYTWGTDDDGDGWGPFVGGGADAYDLVRITIAVEEPVYEYGGHPTPRVHVTLWGDLEKKYYESTEVENAGTTNEVTNVVMRAYSMYVEAYRGTDFSEAYWWGSIRGQEENGKLVAEIDGEGLEEGLNTFVVRNGDTVGFATANVGYDRVDLEIGLEAESAVIPSGIWGSSSGRTAIRRVAINDEECAMRPVWMGQVDGYVTAAQVLANFRNGAIDLDSKYLVEDAAEMGIAADEIRTATYELVETYEYDGEMHSYAWETFDKTFAAARPRATLVTPTAEAAYRVRTRKPTFAFTGLDGCTAFVLEIATDRDDGAVILAATNILPVAWTSAGKSVREFRSDFQIGDGLDLADKSNYFWRVCGLNAKWPTAGDWSDWASFATAVDSTDGATGYGRLAAEVRYYGAATNDASDVIVGVFADAAFAGKPVATAHLKAGNFADLAIAKQDFFKFSPEAPGAVAFDGLEPGDYYVMAFNDRNGNGRRDAWESWGYLNKVGQQVDDRFTPVALKVGPTWGKTVVSGVLFLEDTDVNDNGVPDCIEDELEVRPAAAVDADRDGLDTSDEHWNEYLWGADPEKWDTDGDGLPDGYEVWAGLDPIDAWEGKETYEYTGSNGVARTYTYSTPTAEYAVAGDVMAYAEVDRVMVTFADKTSALVMKGVKRPTVGDTAASCGDGTYEAVYAYGEGIGLGLPFRVVDTGLRITKVEDVKVVLVHSQVYDEFGYDMKTANAWAFAAGNAVNTKAFTAPDKYLLVRYFEALGLCSEDDVNVNRKWDGFALKPGEIDSNRDGIADGWNLYVMFGPDGTVATCTPWTSAAAARTVTSDGDITWVQEYDGGHYPTDPWNAYTLGDYFRSGEGKDEAISDKDAYAYHLKHFDGAEGDKYADFDNDGLCNYDEYDIMKNNNRTLDADNMFSYFGSVTVPALAGQCVPDYFLKSTRSNPKIYEQFETNVYDYLGFDYTSHDFIESWWKDQYQALMPNGGKCVDRTRFEPYADPDADGWDNWSERHGGTDPTREAVLSLVRSDKSEDHVVMAYPTPTIYTTVNYDSGDLLTAPIIVNAWQGGRLTEKPDAIWTVPGSGELSEWNMRFLGLAPNDVMDFSIGPGDVAQSHVLLEFYDPDYTIENWQILTNGTRKSLPTDLHMIDTSAWGVFYYGDNPTDKTFGPDTGTIAYYATGAGDENTSAQFGKALQGSYVNYKNGDIRIDFTADVFRQTDATFTIVEVGSGGDVEATYHRYHYDLTRSFWRIRWMGRLTATGNIRQFSLSKSAEFSDASRGHLREGPNTFVAYADVNGNSAYDPGEPFGCVKDVNVGFERVVDLDINLKKTSPVIPRFNPMDIGEGAGTNDAVTIEYKGKPVVSDLVDYQTVRIVRWEINGDECTHRTVFRKTAEQLGVITEADILSDYAFDLDWAYLERDAAKAGIGFEDIRTVTYAVIVDVGALSPVEEEYVTGWIVKDFSGIRGKATPVAPSKGETAIVTAARPTFEFKAPSGYPAFAFELCDKDGNVVFSSTNHIGTKNAAGNVTYRPPVYFGWDEEADTTNRLLPNGEYTWRVALLSAKYRHAGDWSDAAFTVELAKGKVEDTDKGALDVVVRYYGDATVDAEHPIIVQAFRTADFTGIPEGQTAITNVDLLDSYDDIKTVNAKIYGLAAGDYYICAFIDTTNDVKRMRWESWGYVNNVGTDKADLYMPVPTKVMRNDTTAAVLFIEDMDCNNDRIPDWMDPTDIPWDWPWPEPPVYEEPPVPVTPEEPHDPNDPGGPIPQWFPEVETDPNDVMAYEDLGHVLLVKVALSDADTAARWYAVMDLANEGWKLRDSDIPLQTLSTNLHSLVSTWKMGRFTGIGTNVTFTGDAKVLDTKFEDIRLIHAQVYAKNGYETGCAAICPNEGNDPRLVDGIAAAEHPHTKPFTRADKYYFCRYLENIGVAGVSEAKMIAEVEAALKGVDPADYETVARPIWSKYTLDPDAIDMDRDDVADAWEAYAMFGVTDLGVFTGTREQAHEHWALADLKVSPFNTADGMLVAPGAGSQLKLVEEFDGGYYPTDPWSADTDRDGVIDFYAYQYHLKGSDAGKDFDLDEKGEWTGDGLSNYAEYLISEVFQYAKLDPENPKTDGYCIDYFRKVGDLYFGEIFTDHDQVGDSWEGSYDAFANRYVYDPERDDDKDGWSNYAEFRAGTDPSTGDTYGIDGYTRAEYPVPVIEAKVIYNGNDVNLGSIVFKAWNEETDPKMTSAPDAIWTIGNGKASEATETTESGKSGSTLQDYEKYVGRKPSGVQRYALGGGTVAGGTIKLEFMNKQFTDVSYPTNGTEKVSGKPTEKPGDPKNAQWYLAARDDGNGHVVTLTGETIGKVDYKHGILEVDFDSQAICGMTTGDKNDKFAYATIYTDGGGNHGYDRFSFDDAHVLVSWQAKLVGFSADGTYTLGDADLVTEAAKNHGHVREGLTTFLCFSDENADGLYTAGEPFGVVRGVDVGWQGAKFTVELTETVAITPRVKLWDGTSDRDTYIDEPTYGEYDSRNPTVGSNVVSGLNLNLQLPKNESVRIRVVRYAVDGFYTYSCGVPNRVVLDRYFEKDVCDTLCESDFLSDGKFDIDWDDLKSEVCSPLAGYHYDVTNMSYLIVIGNGPAGFTRTYQTNEADRVTALASAADPAKALLVTRRFEKTWSKPKAIGLKEGSILYGSRPTFVWSMPNESAYAKRFGSSYTAFRIQVVNTDTDELVWISDVLKTPVQDKDGNFTWVAPFYVGDQTPSGQVFAKAGNYEWYVAMYNSKFKPHDDYDDQWSDPSAFSTSVDTQQETDDRNYSAVDVSVKYAGPVDVLKTCADLEKTAGKVRIQAFTTADFSGEPVAQGIVTNSSALADTANVLANGRLIGLGFGTYYIRAYIDSNGNFRKDDWESWGYAKDAVVVKAGQLAPIAGIYIEDADTDRDWLPDAWEYVKYGDLATEGAKVDPQGRIVLKTTVYDGLLAAATKANFSRDRSGATLAFFNNIGNATLLLGLDDADVTLAGIADIRAAVEKKIEEGSVRITSLVVDATSGKVILTVGARTTDSIAGYMFSPVYEIPTSTDVTIKIYKKENLATDAWTLEKTVKKTIESTMSEQIKVDTGVNFNSGFFKVEVVK